MANDPSQLALSAEAQGASIADPLALQALQQAMAEAAALLSGLPARADGATLLQQAFGSAGTAEAEFQANLQALVASLQAEGLQLNVELRSGAEMGGALGAYAASGPDGTERVYLNADWISSGASVEDIVRVLLEEAGHAIDQRLNAGVDSAGDEGELFAALVTGAELSDEQRAAILAENDAGQLLIDGQSIAVEYDQVDTIDSVSFSSDSGSSSTDRITNTAAQTVTVVTSNRGNQPGGSADAAPLLWYSTNGGTTRTAATLTAGSWTNNANNATKATFTFSATLSGSGSLTFYNVSTGGSAINITGGSATTFSYSIDTTAPALPVITSAALTNDTTPVISGTAEANSTVTLTVAGATYTTTAGAGGAWSVDTGSATPNSGALSINANGNNSVSVTATDAAGNVSTAATQTLVVDTTAPTTSVTISSINQDSGVSSSDFITKDNNGLTIAASLSAALGAGEKLQYSNNNGSSWVDVSGTDISGTSVSLVDAALTTSRTIQFRVVDAAGNAGTAASQLVTIDTTAPATPVISSAEPNGTVSAVISGTAEAGSSLSISVAGAVYTVTANGSGAWSLDTATATATSGTLALTGSDTVSVTATDVAGNTSGAATQSLLVRQALTSTTLGSTSTVQTLNRQAAGQIALTVTYNQANVTGEDVLVAAFSGSTLIGWTIYNRKNALTSPGAGSAVTDTLVLPFNLAQFNTDILSGGITFKVWQGRTSPGGAAEQNDLSSTTSGTTATVDFGINSSTAATTTLSSTTSGSTSATWTNTIVDVTAPTTTVTITSIADDTGATTDFITKDNNGLTVGASLSSALSTGDKLQYSNNNGSSWIDVSATDISGTNVSIVDANLTSTTTIQFRVVDAAGNVGTASAQLITIDTTAPATPVITSAAATGATSAAISGTAVANSTITISFGGAVYNVTANGSGAWSLNTATTAPTTGPLVLVGNDLVTVTATDTAGNISTAATQKLAPQQLGAPDLIDASDTGASQSDNLTSDTTPTFSGVGANPGATVFLYNTTSGNQDGTGVADASGNWSITVDTSLADGSYAYAVRQRTDASGNESPVSSTLTVTIDSAAPTAPANSLSLKNDSGTLNDGITRNVPEFSLGDLVTSTLAGQQVSSAPAVATPIYGIGDVIQVGYLDGSNNFVVAGTSRSLTQNDFGGNGQLVQGNATNGLGKSIQIALSGTLAAGSYQFFVRVVDPAGNASALSPQAFPVTLLDPSDQPFINLLAAAVDASGINVGTAIAGFYLYNPERLSAAALAIDFQDAADKNSGYFEIDLSGSAIRLTAAGLQAYTLGQLTLPKDVQLKLTGAGAPAQSADLDTAVLMAAAPSAPESVFFIDFVDAWLGSPVDRLGRPLSGSNPNQYNYFKSSVRLDASGTTFRFVAATDQTGAVGNNVLGALYAIDAAGNQLGSSIQGVVSRVNKTSGDVQAVYFYEGTDYPKTSAGYDPSKKLVLLDLQGGSQFSAGNVYRTSSDLPRSLFNQLNLDVNSVDVNEASKYAVFAVKAQAGQFLELELEDGSATGGGSAPPSDGTVDYRNDTVQYSLDNGVNWSDYSSAFAVNLTGAAKRVLVRVALVNDDPYEGEHDFKLKASYTGLGIANVSATGTATIYDDGFGDLLALDESGNPLIDGSGGTLLDEKSIKDDDRQLTVSGQTYNEGSAHIYWTVHGEAGFAIKVLSLVGDPSDSALPDGDLTGILEYFNGTEWVAFCCDKDERDDEDDNEEDEDDNEEDEDCVRLDPSGKLLIRKAIVDDSPYEGKEDFILSVGYVKDGQKDASGASSLIDDGTGTYVDSSGNVDPSDVVLDDDRQLSVSGQAYNEGSAHIYWTIQGEAGLGVTYRSLVGDPVDEALPEVDLSGNLEYFDGDSWILFDASASPLLDASGALQIRKAVNNDATYEGKEDFVLSVGYAKGGLKDASGTSSLIDDGTGIVVDLCGNVVDPSNAILDDDRQLSVSGGVYNEGSAYIYWTIQGEAGLGVVLRSLIGDPVDAAEPEVDLSGNLEYFDGDSWILFDGSANSQLDASGELQIRKTVVDDSPYEGKEDFILSVGYAKGALKDASGTSSLIDDGTGKYVDSSGNIDPSDAVLDDDRQLSVSGEAYNEGSAHIYWTIQGEAGLGVTYRSLVGDPVDEALPEVDLSGNLEYFDGDSWILFDASASPLLDASGALQIRKAVNNDATYEGKEDFVLSVGYAKGGLKDASGTSSLIDDGTGIVVDLCGNVVDPSDAILDDDRQLSVSGGVYNEGSAYIYWTIQGEAGLGVLLRSLAGDPVDAAEPEVDLSGNLEYFDGDSWILFDGSANSQLDASGELQIRKTVVDDSPYEGKEDFILSVGYAKGALKDASGTSSLIDDGTGKYVDSSGNIDPSDVVLDDDRLLSVSGATYNEGSAHIYWTIQGEAGLAVKYRSLVGDPVEYAEPEVDLSGNLEYFDGDSWILFDGSANPLLDASGALLIRKAVINDATFEGKEGFVLSVGYSSGGVKDASGVSYLKDDGTGIYVDPSGTVDPSGVVLDDDRGLTVTAYGPLNEGPAGGNTAVPTLALFLVKAAPGLELSLELGNTASLLDKDATIAGFIELQYSLDGGANWIAYQGANKPTAPLSGKVLVRVNISSEWDDPYEGPETFTLTATYTTGSPQKATGIATIIDNGTGDIILLDGSGNPQFDGSGNPRLDDRTKDDDRSNLSIPDVIVNEASPYVVFQIFGTGGKTYRLQVTDGAFDYDAPNDTGAIGSQKAIGTGGADPSGFDFRTQLEVYNGSTWLAYVDASGVSTASGSSVLLVRVPLINDALYEGAHAFTITATDLSNNKPASGRAIISDFGTGLIFNDSGNENRLAVKDDDRALRVDSPIVNEASDFVVFRVRGITSAVQLSLLFGNGTGFATLPTPDLNYWTGSAWQPYTAAALLTPGTEFSTGSELYVRVSIKQEQDDPYENFERFTLDVSGAGGPSQGVATIRDDGTGDIPAFGPSGNLLLDTSGNLILDKLTTKDDDLDRDGIAPTTEDALSTLVASQNVPGAKPGDLNGDGTPDAEQKSLATLAWRDVNSFTAGNEGTLTDYKPVISLIALEDASGGSVSSTLQLENIRVVDYNNPSEFPSGGGVTVDSSGTRTVPLVGGGSVLTAWDPLRFEVAPQDGAGAFIDIDPSRNGTQVRMFIDMRASDLDASVFNAYVKYVSRQAIDASGDLLDLSGSLISTPGWYDFTQRTPGGDGARFVVNNGKIQGIEMILTDNAFGDNDPSLNRILDPGAPVFTQPAAELVPTEDGKGLKVVGTPGLSLWLDLSVLLSSAVLQNSYNLIRRTYSGQSFVEAAVGAIGGTTGAGFFGDTRVQLGVGEELRFALKSGNKALRTSPNITITGQDNVYTLRLDDSDATIDRDFNDLTLNVQARETNPLPLATQMAALQTSMASPYLDLRWIPAEGVTLSVDVQTDNSARDVLRLVRLDPNRDFNQDGSPRGTVSGVAPTAGLTFDQAVRNALLPFTHSRSSAGTSNLSLNLSQSQAGVYMPVLFSSTGALYNAGFSTSLDTWQRVKVLGANSFAFEAPVKTRLDWDFNDLVVNFRVAESTPRLSIGSGGRTLQVTGGTAGQGLWLDLSAVLSSSTWQNNLDLIKVSASSQRSAVGSIGTTANAIATRAFGVYGSSTLFLETGESLEFRDNSNDRPVGNTPLLRITQVGERFVVAMDDRAGSGGKADNDFNDLVLNIDSSTQPSNQELDALTGFQRNSADGVLDLRAIDASGARLLLQVNTDSLNANSLYFVRLDDGFTGDPLSGDPLTGLSVGGVLFSAGAAAFRNAVNANLGSALVTAGGISSRTLTWDVTTPGFYAPVLRTPSGQVFTLGDTTASDGRQHLKLLGDNTFGFEELTSTQRSDFDYNDLTLQVLQITSIPQP